MASVLAERVVGQRGHAQQDKHSGGQHRGRHVTTLVTRQLHEREQQIGEHAMPGANRCFRPVSRRRGE